MKLKRRPYMEDDIPKMDVAKHFRHYFGAEKFKHWCSYRKKGIAYTYYDEDTGEILACCGLIPLDERSANIWLVLSHNVIRYPKLVYQQAKRFVNEYCDRFKRVQATVRFDVPNGIRFLEKLGFEFEGLLRAFDYDDSDVVLMARVR